MTALQALRIILGYKTKEFADIFMCTSAYISAIENGDRSISKRTLMLGLINLNINYDRYEELADFASEIAAFPDEKLDEQNKRRLMLLKAMAVTEKNPDLIECYNTIIARNLGSDKNMQKVYSV